MHLILLQLLSVVAVYGHEYYGYDGQLYTVESRELILDTSSGAPDHHCAHNEISAALRTRLLEQLPRNHSAQYSLNMRPDPATMDASSRRKLLDPINPSMIRFTPIYQLGSLDATKVDLIQNSILPSAFSILRRALRVHRPVVGNLKLTRTCTAALTVNDTTYCTAVKPIGTCLAAIEDPSYYGPFQLYYNDTSTGYVQRNGTVPGGPGIANTDVVVYVTANQTTDSVTCTANTYAFGQYCSLDLDTSRPVAITINFCPSALTLDPSLRGTIIDTAVHEMTHGLVFSATLYNEYRDSNNVKYLSMSISPSQMGEPVDLGPYTAITTPAVLNVVQRNFGCSDVFTIGGTLENGGGPGTAGNHWEYRFFKGELMTGVASSKERQLLSSLTLALYQDSGWYDIAPGYPQPTLSMGFDQGCDFYNLGCATVPLSSTLRDSGFCDRTTDPNAWRYRCSADRVTISRCQNAFLTENRCDDAQPTVTSDGDPARCTDPTLNNFVDNFWKGQRFGPQSRCLEYDATHAFTRRGITLDGVTPGCWRMDCNGASGGLRVEVFGKFTDCPEGSYIDLSTFDTGFSEDAPMTGRLGPCPAKASVCPSLRCTTNADCGNRGTCFNGNCNCFLGYGGADCSVQVCTTDANKTNSCPPYQTCNPTTLLCQAKAGTAQPPPPPPSSIYTPPSPLPAAAVVRNGVMNPSPITSCIMVGDMDGDLRAEYYDFLGSSNGTGYWQVKTSGSSPLVVFDPAPVAGPTINPASYACRDKFTGQASVFRYRNAIGGNILSPLSTLHALTKIRYPDRTDDSIRVDLQSCLGIPLTENILSTPDGQDPLRVLAYNAVGGVSNATKQHHYVNVALLNGMSLLGMNLADSFRTTGIITAGNMIAGGDALLTGIGLRCLNGSAFDPADSESWYQAAVYGFAASGQIGYLTVPEGAGNARSCNCAATCFCNAIKAVSVTNLTSDINLAWRRRVFESQLVGVDIVADGGKIQYIVQSAYSPYTQYMLVQAYSLSLHTTLTSTAGSTADFPRRFRLNTTFDGYAVLTALAKDPSDVIPPSPPPARSSGSGSKTKKAGGGIVAAYIFIFLFGVAFLGGVAAWWLRWSNRKQSALASSTDRIVSGPSFNIERTNLLGEPDPDFKASVRGPDDVKSVRSDDIAIELGTTTRATGGLGLGLSSGLGKIDPGQAPPADPDLFVMHNNPAAQADAQVNPFAQRRAAGGLEGPSGSTVMATNTSAAMTSSAGDHGHGRANEREDLL